MLYFRRSRGHLNRGVDRPQSGPFSTPPFLSSPVNSVLPFSIPLQRAPIAAERSKSQQKISGAISKLRLRLIGFRQGCRRCGAARSSIRGTSVHPCRYELIRPHLSLINYVFDEARRPFAEARPEERLNPASLDPGTRSYRRFWNNVKIQKQ